LKLTENVKTLAAARNARTKKESEENMNKKERAEDQFQRMDALEFFKSPEK